MNQHPLVGITASFWIEPKTARLEHGRDKYNSSVSNLPKYQGCWGSNKPSFLISTSIDARYCLENPNPTVTKQNRHKWLLRLNMATLAQPPAPVPTGNDIPTYYQVPETTYDCMPASHPIKALLSLQSQI
jgi:hypothetical protein